MPGKNKNRQIYARLVSAVFSLVVAAVLAVSATFAWMTLSTKPALSGAGITVGGSDFLLLAPDVTETQTVGDNTAVYHYPGVFSPYLGFTEFPAGKLTPVSTADGVNWIFKYRKADALPDAGGSYSAEDYVYEVDRSLSRADEESGGYIYFDFWAVSPTANATVRLSRGGSYSRSGQSGSATGTSVLCLPFDASGNAASSALDGCVRVGFLTNTLYIPAGDNLAYSHSAGFDPSYTRLKGRFAEKGESGSQPTGNFAIYEPNAGSDDGNGGTTYNFTRPLGFANGISAEAENVTALENGPGHELFYDNLTVGLASGWRPDNTNSTVAQDYTGWMNLSGGIGSLGGYLSAKKDLSPYIDPGMFIKSTLALYQQDFSVQGLESLETAGATGDVVVFRLEKNVPQRIRVFVWIESEDSELPESFDGNAYVVLNLEFAGAPDEPAGN